MVENKAIFIEPTHYLLKKLTNMILSIKFTAFGGSHKIILIKGDNDEERTASGKKGT